MDYIATANTKKIKIMKKVLVILALTLFIGGVSAPVIAANSNAHTLISLQKEDPKKDEKKAEKSETSKEATKSKSCSEGEKKDCSKQCGNK